MFKNPSSLRRLWQIRKVIRRHQLANLLTSLNLSTPAKLLIHCLFGKTKNSPQARAERIRLALEELGPVFIKLGQALSTRPDLLPPDIALELSKLQDQVPPFDDQQATQIIEQAYGEEYHEIFAEVSPTPLASASVAQVHAAKLHEKNALEGKNGKKSVNVIVKILRPNIRSVIDADLAVMYRIASFLQNHWARANQFKPLEVIEQYDTTIKGELDLRHEAANCSQMAANFASSDLIYVPQVYWDYTQTDVMVMERIYGTSIRDLDQLKQQEIDFKQLAEDGVAVFFKQAFEDNFFHADMHPGNIFVSNQGQWIAVDFGIMGTLTNQDKQYLAEMFLGFFNRDYRTIAEAHLRAEWVPANTNLEEFESAVRMVCEPNFAKPISEISFGKVMLQLVQTVQRFEIPIQPQLVLLYKTLLNIEGLGRQLYPELNLWDTAKPFLEDWMKKQLSPQTLFDDFKRDWPRWRLLLKELPNTLELLSSTEKFKSRSNNHSQHGQAQVQRRLKTSLLIVAASLLLPALDPSHHAIINHLPWVTGLALIWAWFQIKKY
jgi:ubiquinone biosynthesis protein